MEPSGGQMEPSGVQKEFKWSSDTPSPLSPPRSFKGRPRAPYAQGRSPYGGRIDFINKGKFWSFSIFHSRGAWGTFKSIPNPTHPRTPNALPLSRRPDFDRYRDDV